MRRNKSVVPAVAMTFALTFGLNVRAQVSIAPPMPNLYDTVRMVLPERAFGSTSELFDFRSTRVTMAANKITVALVSPGRGAGLPEPSPRFDVPLGQFPAGEYQVDVRVESPEGTTIRSVGSSSFVVTSKTIDDPVFNLTDLWWDPSESGWGLNLIQHSSNIVFATWFAYDPDGSAAWYVVPDGRWIAGTGYTGPIYRTTGPAFCFEGEVCAGTGFNPSAVTRTLVGEMVLSIEPSNFDRANVRFTIGGKTLSRNITRQSF